MNHRLSMRRNGSQFEVRCTCGFVAPALSLSDGNRIEKIHIEGEREKEKLSAIEQSQDGPKS